MTQRQIIHIVDSMPTSDGAGVKLRRSLGAGRIRLDPFLMLDEFSSEEASDYIAGFPAHPHRGFETVTYMLDGHMRHEDNFGHRGELTSGGVQWMTAGRGIIHSEMPQQESGRMRGFQLWINLPASEKMKPAAYRDIPATEIPVVALDGGGRVKVIAGSFGAVDGPIDGPINGRASRISTDPTYFDVELPAGASFSMPVASGYTAFLYPFEGALEVGPEGKRHKLKLQQAGALSDGDALEVVAGPDGARFIVLAAKPLREPVVQYGPFVMNTREEIEQAIADYQRGNFGHPEAA